MRKFFKYFFWFLTVALMVLIFSFSAEKAEESQKTSEGLTKKVLMCFSSFRELPEKSQTAIIESIQFIVRKSAHFSAYGALGLSLYSALLLTFSKKLLWLYAFLGSFVYAISDEIHQFFVPGRSMELRDVLIDSSGALAGILFVALIVKIATSKKTHIT